MILEAQTSDREAATSESPRIALVYGDYPPKPLGKADGGAEFVRHLAEGLVRRRFDVTAIISRRADRQTAYQDRGVDVQPVIDDWRLRSGIGGQMRRIRELLRVQRVDIVHVIYPDPYLRYGSDSYHLPFLLKSSGLPVVVTLFGFGITGASLVTKTGLVILFATSDALVITDPDLLTRFRKHMPFWARKTAGGFVGSIAPPNSPLWSQTELASRQRDLRLPGDFSYVGFFGFWGPGKGLEELIGAVARLRREGEAVKLVLIGGREPEHRTDYERGVLAEVRRAGIEDLVIETGHLSARDVAAHLVAMDVCVLPIRVNPLGRSSLALALTLGVPTVVTRPAGHEDLLPGIPLLDVVDEAHIVSAVRPILRERSRQLQCSEAANAAASHWSWDSIVDQYAELYRKLQNQRRR